MARRTRIVVRRHAQPMKDPETNKSLDNLTEQGMLDSIEAGKSYADHEGSITLYHSGMTRAMQTACGINVGIGKVVAYAPSNFDSRFLLGQQYFADAENKPAFKRYDEFINKLLAQNPGLADRVGMEVMTFVSMVYRRQESEKSPLVVGISHGPKVEISFAQIIGAPDDVVGEFAANPLDGYEVRIDENDKGIIQRATIDYRGEGAKKLDTTKLLL